MKKTTQLPRRNLPQPDGPAARKWAIFFYMATLVLGLFGIITGISCANTDTRSEEEVLVQAGESRIVSGLDSDSVLYSEEKSPGLSIEGTGNERERMRAQEQTLQWENDRLRSEVIRLHQALAEANRTIYSLNRKLDAIFEPEMGEE